MEISPEKLEICLEVLQQISEEPSVISHHERMKGLIAKIHREGKRCERRLTSEREQAEDRNLRNTTAMVWSQQANRPVATLPQTETLVARRLKRPVQCYVCKTDYTELHFFYHKLCPTCATFNYAKREQRADLTGRVALLTGGRIKIGYQTALRLLRDGARVLVTTRFPKDAARRFCGEPDADAWQHRLQIFGLDLRNLPAVEAFLTYLLETLPHLDIIINNAAQTIRRPAEFYRAEQEQERQSAQALPEVARRLLANSAPDFRPLLEAGTADQSRIAELSNSLPDVLKEAINTDVMDADGQPLDTRPTNSWSLLLDQVSTAEMLETQLVNTISPFMLNSRLKPLLLRSPFERRFIVNVSAMEGQFNREAKTPYHPHTNMAKAALNMMTRTSAVDYARDGIYMNSVDTGWITDENPHDKKIRLRDTNGFYTPLDVIDGTARIYDPIARGEAEPSEPLHGHFLKDYVPSPW